MMNVNQFLFKKYGFDPKTGELSLHYAFDQGPAFVEVISFPVPRQDLSADRKAALDQAFRVLFLLAGVSYYKAAIPPRLVCEAFALDPKLAAFCDEVYRGGLGEFAYRNKVKLDFAFEVADAQPRAAGEIGLPHRMLVPVGGGKDSIVTIEALKNAGKDITLFALGGETLAMPIAKTIEVSGLSHIPIKRKISPELIELNAQGALNGHVPITAILSAITVCCAILYGFDAVVLSNESSANAPNVVCDGVEVNHQFSKSLAFEKSFASLVRDTVATDLRYISLLRPLTETAIASRFAKLEAYYPVFRSCNTAFRQNEAKRGTRWCCDCPKCRFVFLALAPFMKKEKLIAIFGRDMLDDPAQLDGFKELCGLSAIKPFECVGEIEESQALLAALVAQAAWKDSAIVAALAPLITPRVTVQDLLARRDEHLLSDEELKVIDAL